MKTVFTLLFLKYSDKDPLLTVMKTNEYAMQCICWGDKSFPGGCGCGCWISL